MMSRKLDDIYKQQDEYNKKKFNSTFIAKEY